MSAELLSWTTYDSPLGRLTLIAGPSGIRGVRFPGRQAQPAQARWRPMRAAVEQLTSYFAGELKVVELALELRGSALQLAVWEQLLGIPYGATTTYGELARRIDDALYPPELEPYRRARLVGAAIGATPTPILVPCHRAIGADGSLTGYGGGLQRKRALLELENARTAPELRPRDPADAQLALL
jgi:methylated-DNA-[protein]-cysteine S-methyltransferase